MAVSPPSDPELRYQAYVEELRAEFPGLRLVDKRDSLLQRSIDRALRLLTLGGQSAYATEYVTTIGESIYLPSSWATRGADDRYATLRHEAVHLRQFRRWTLPLMAIAYLLVPLPLGLAYCRMRLEREAYEETLRVSVELWGKAHVCNAAFRARILAQFIGPAYGWMWPFRGALERWYDGFVASL